jgi:exonuclease III
MTWNIEEFPLASSTASEVVNIIAEYQPDLIAVQEIMDQDAFLALAAAMPDYEGILANDSNAFMVVGLLYRTDTVNIGQARTLFAGDDAFPRPPLAVWLTVADGGGFVSFNLVVVVIHLKAQLDGESQERRRLACERLMAWMDNEVANGVEDDIVALGDWNDELQDPPQENVFQPFLDRPEFYTFLTRDMYQGGTFTYIPFESFIDHVLVTNNALEEYGQGVTRVLALDFSHSNYRDVISDHRPVLVTFELP